MGAPVGGTYSQSIDFSAKDALTSGNPAKVIKGADVDTELGLIATAVNAKADATGAQADVITTRGDLVYGNSTPAAARLPIGTANQVLQSDGTDVAWATLTTAAITGHGDNPKATTSGTEADFTSIPAGTKRITFVLNGVSCGSAHNLQLVLGDSGGFETSGYTSSRTELPNGGSTSTVIVTSAYTIFSFAATADLVYGKGVLVLEDDTNEGWSLSFAGHASGATDKGIIASGNKDLSAELTQLRFNFDSGGSFDAGTISVFTEAV